MPHVRITHMLNTGYQAAELALGVFGIESVAKDGTVGGVASGATVACRNVTVDQIDAAGSTLEATTEQITRAREIADAAAEMDAFIATVLHEDAELQPEP
ncbi:hypothetical protein [Mycobacterium marinum]|uniref:hypothetical protein n=1 Tax=Mycobacterium marinum TaxID=1781 RepID=UPI00045FD203|nr:hypothetical protein [Mycobacterium marinum]CDM76132.1 hypothetical protein MMARE11_19850 [Mycobacterium marinum E11]